MIQDPIAMQPFDDVLRREHNFVEGSAFYKDQQEFFQTVYTKQLDDTWKYFGWAQLKPESNVSYQCRIQRIRKSGGKNLIGGKYDSDNVDERSLSGELGKYIGFFYLHESVPVLDGKSVALMESRDGFKIADFSGMQGIRRRCAGGECCGEAALDCGESVIDSVLLDDGNQGQRNPGNDNQKNFQLKLQKTTQSAIQPVSKVLSNSDLLKLNPSQVLKMQRTEIQNQFQQNQFQNRREKQGHRSLRERQRAMTGPEMQKATDHGVA
jgi:hypothetical protein